MQGEYYINLSGIYDGYEPEIDCKDVEGTNCYCDDAAKDTLRKRLSHVPTHALHYLDSGNYHYLSYFFLERITKDFALVLFDRHPDYQLPSFGDILSCGGWVKNAFDDLNYLKKVYMVGVDENLFSALKDVPKEVKLLGINDVADISMELPIYISIDKDVLAKTWAACDWDQGELSLWELRSALEVLKKHNVLGVDVCGEKKESPSEEDLYKNESVNEEIRNLFRLRHDMI